MILLLSTFTKRYIEKTVRSGPRDSLEILLDKPRSTEEQKFGHQIKVMANHHHHNCSRATHGQNLLYLKKMPLMNFRWRFMFSQNSEKYSDLGHFSEHSIPRPESIPLLPKLCISHVNQNIPKSCFCMASWQANCL